MQDPVFMPGYKPLHAGIWLPYADMQDPVYIDMTRLYCVYMDKTTLYNNHVFFYNTHLDSRTLLESPIRLHLTGLQLLNPKP